MFKQFFVTIIIASFIGFLFGIYNIFHEVEDNACRMTYMFGKPQFFRVKVKENEHFPKYGLYYYSEGNVISDIEKQRLFGAPLIFLSGNAGSYKQVRSLASVALRKAMDIDHRISLDYFAIDYNEELSALYGGYLENQKIFLKACITAVLQLYEDTISSKRKVVLIGHSMGGIIAEAVLDDEDTALLINSIIFISTPLKRPVVNFDAKINEFYANVSSILDKHRAIREINSQTNVCCNTAKLKAAKQSTSVIQQILFISIGGGNRDLLVPSGLTSSKYGDIHAMTSAIPYVWLSCDHLSSMWCLQLMLVVNRFLFKITEWQKGNLACTFVENKDRRLEAAKQYFVKSQARIRDLYVQPEAIRDNAWHENSQRVTNKKFNNGITKMYNQLIFLEKFTKYQNLYVEVVNIGEESWLYGCVGHEVRPGKHVCTNGTAIVNELHTIPFGKDTRSVAVLDLRKIRKRTDWTHILIRLPPTDKKINFNIDIFDSHNRYLPLRMPPLFDLKSKTLVEETLQGSLYYKLLITNLKEPFQSLKVSIKPKACVIESYRVTTKVCVPWAPGFDRYKVIDENTRENFIYVNVPTIPPAGYNLTKNPVVLEIFLDPVCRFAISYEYATASTLARTVQEYYQWIPAHFVAVLLIVMKNQIVKIHTAGQSHKLSRPYTGFFQSTSMYIVTGYRLVKKLVLPVEVLPMVDATSHSLYVTLFIHSVAIMLAIIASFAVWVMLCFQGNLLHSCITRLTRFRSCTSSALIFVMNVVPLSFGVALIAITIATCSGVGLLLACAFYFMMLSNSYKDYLEDWVWEKATGFVRRRLCTQAPDQTDNETTDNVVSEQSTDDNGSVDSDKDTTGGAPNMLEGLQNYSYHVTLLLLLSTLAILNLNITMAWVRSRSIMRIADPSFYPTAIVLVCLSLLLQIKAPHKIFGYHLLCGIMYVGAAAAIIYCQQDIYRLNYIIAAAFVILLLGELIGRLYQKVFK